MAKLLLANLAAGLAMAGGVAVTAQQPPQPAAKAAANTGEAIDRNILHVQVILDHLGFGPGILDGRPGMSLTAALKGFQESRGLPETGKMDPRTLGALKQYAGWRPTKQLRLTQAALAGPFINPIPKDEAEQAKLPAMAYRSPLEKLAEMFHTTPEVLIALNSPQTRLAPGQLVTFPNALPTSRDYQGEMKPEWRQTLTNLNVDARQPKGAKIVVDKSDAVLRVLDANDKLVGQFQATMGSARDPLPLGNWKVLHISPLPDWKFNPLILKKVPDTKQAQVIPPGPNSPVGVVWIDLSKEHYGIHGTAEPRQIGRAQSNGCVRLTNWDAARVALMVKNGIPVVFQA
ncbi:L,D-transpeptidase family protein [Sphingomonas sp.]|jgi:lipoprotein-anchoring transpeptidase ErfK/SrfK|uniref:L,D-transpeptidase family protein n=1 Tax=Sphingomonas sp. TaxID=28214 RepID=UPI002D7F64FA|nr:L,D-transpeptidase family protein [Sphingomonas sp.]HEU0044936.1 L,D-transpeptidase family protein [Sphingomonas sp.]